MVTVPVKAFPSLPAAPLAGMTVIDTCNYGPELDSKSLTSTSELLLLLLHYIPEAMLVKAFNSIARHWPPQRGSRKLARASVKSGRVRTTSGRFPSRAFGGVLEGQAPGGGSGQLRDVQQGRGAGRPRRHP
ncbi:hypothetical protein [Streptomyces sp. SM11]|uniref:hypothetical protein n=1 Tax=Streptomyces sp. SM11 TaxID=565557 RepID=UPI002156616A|nr:hypothetical protein [Streptomyces sp. SM11]